MALLHDHIPWLCLKGVLHSYVLNRAWDTKLHNIASKSDNVWCRPYHPPAGRSVKQCRRTPTPDWLQQTGMPATPNRSPATGRSDAQTSRKLLDRESLDAARLLEQPDASAPDLVVQISKATIEGLSLVRAGRPDRRDRADRRATRMQISPQDSHAPLAGPNGSQLPTARRCCAPSGSSAQSLCACSPSGRRGRLQRGLRPSPSHSLTELRRVSSRRRMRAPKSSPHRYQRPGGRHRGDRTLSARLARLQCSWRPFLARPLLARSRIDREGQ
jgi:hypothetical protein